MGRRIHTRTIELPDAPELDWDLIEAAIGFIASATRPPTTLIAWAESDTEKVDARSIQRLLRRGLPDAPNRVRLWWPGPWVREQWPVTGSYSAYRHGGDGVWMHYVTISGTDEARVRGVAQAFEEHLGRGTEALVAAKTPRNRIAAWAVTTWREHRRTVTASAITGVVGMVFGKCA